MRGRRKRKRVKGKIRRIFGVIFNRERVNTVKRM